MSIEFILLVAGVAAVMYLCRFVEGLVFHKKSRKENRGSTRQYEESEPEDLASQYRK